MAQAPPPAHQMPATTPDHYQVIVTEYLLFSCTCFLTDPPEAQGQIWASSGVEAHLSRVHDVPPLGAVVEWLHIQTGGGMGTGHHRHIQQGNVLAAMPGARRGLGHPWDVTAYVNHLYHVLVCSGAHRRSPCIPRLSKSIQVRVRIDIGWRLPMSALKVPLTSSSAFRS